MLTQAVVADFVRAVLAQLLVTGFVGAGSLSASSWLLGLAGSALVTGFVRAVLAQLLVTGFVRAGSLSASS